MNDELVKALRECGGDGRCWKCPYYSTHAYPECENKLYTDAADALEAAEKRIAELEKQLPKQDSGICMTACGTLYVPNYDD